MDGLHASLAALQRALDQQRVRAQILLCRITTKPAQEAMEALQIQLGNALQHGRHAAQRRREALTDTAARLHSITDTMVECTLHGDVHA